MNNVVCRDHDRKKCKNSQMLTFSLNHIIMINYNNNKSHLPEKCRSPVCQNHVPARLVSGTDRAGWSVVPARMGFFGTGPTGWLAW
jgi:hypothetical protein